MAVTAVPATARAVADPSQYCTDYHCPESTAEVSTFVFAFQVYVNPPLIGIVDL